MNGVCDICQQPRAGFMFEGTNDKNKKEWRYICFDCIFKNAVIGIDLAKKPQTKEGENDE